MRYGGIDMATIYWVGNTSNAWETAANWSGAAIPTGADDVVFTESRVGTNKNVAGLKTTYVPANIFIDPTYTGNIGSSGTYLEFDASNVTQLYIAGLGEYYFTCDTGDAITTTVVNTPNMAPTAVSLDSAGTLTAVYVIRGHCNIVSGATVPTLNVAYSTMSAGDSDVTVQSGVTLTTLNQTAGKVNCDSAMTTLNCNGGNCEVTTGNITTVNVNGGGHFQYSTDGGVLTTLNIYSGTASLATEGTTKSVGSTNVYNGGTFDIRSGSATATLTLSNAPKSFGGRVLQSGSAFQVNQY